LPRADTFDKNARTTKWFGEHRCVYLSEPHAAQDKLPIHGSGIDVGIGTGRFALPLGIEKRNELSRSMAKISKGKGIDIVAGVAENLPYINSQFDFCLYGHLVLFSCQDLRPGNCHSRNRLGRDRDGRKGEQYSVLFMGILRDKKGGFSSRSC
jgi:hypothetical protein